MSKEKENSFWKYVSWLNANSEKMNEQELKDNDSKLQRGVSMMRQIYLSSGEEFQLPEMKRFKNAKKMISEIRWVDLKIKEYPVIGIWNGANHKTKDGKFIFNLEWLNEFTEENIDTEQARFNLKLYMDFDCEPLDENWNK